MKTWGELKEDIISLGFAKESTFIRYERHMITAVNRAMTMICATVRPIKRCWQVEQDRTTEYDLRKETADFMGLLLPVKVRGTDVSVSSRCTVNGCVVIEGAGEFDVYYSAKPERITDSTSDDYVLPLDTDVVELLPLLASYFIWLDDDERKAVMYWNNYEDMKMQILSMEQGSRPITVRVQAGTRRSIFDAFRVTM